MLAPFGSNASSQPEEPIRAPPTPLPAIYSRLISLPQLFGVQGNLRLEARNLRLLTYQKAISNVGGPDGVTENSIQKSREAHET